jgi:hypothetical protein
LLEVHLIHRPHVGGVGGPRLEFCHIAPARPGERGEALSVTSRRGESRPRDAGPVWAGHPAGLGGPRAGGAAGPSWFSVCPAALVACSSSVDARVLALEGGVAAAGRRPDAAVGQIAGQAINRRTVKRLAYFPEPALGQLGLTSATTWGPGRRAPRLVVRPTVNEPLNHWSRVEVAHAGQGVDALADIPRNPEVL